MIASLLLFSLTLSNPIASDFQNSQRHIEGKRSFWPSRRHFQPPFHFRPRFLRWPDLHGDSDSTTEDSDSPSQVTDSISDTAHAAFNATCGSTIEGAIAPQGTFESFVIIDSDKEKVQFDSCGSKFNVALALFDSKHNQIASVIDTSEGHRRSGCSQGKVVLAKELKEGLYFLQVTGAHASDNGTFTILVGCDEGLHRLPITTYVVIAVVFAGLCFGSCAYLCFSGKARNYYQVHVRREHLVPLISTPGTYTHIGTAQQPVFAQRVPPAVMATTNALPEQGPTR